MKHWLLRLFGAKPDTRAPHEIWPEILHWQEGDDFDVIHGMSWCSEVCGRFVAIDMHGIVTLRNNSTPSQLWQIHVKHLVGRNEDYNTRCIKNGLTESREYMDLLREFNLSVRQLEERDRRNGIKAA